MEKSNHAGRRKRHVRRISKNTGKYKDIIILIRGWSSVSVNQLKTRTDKIDFLFIDGDHSYEGCKTDWDYYSPLLKKNQSLFFMIPDGQKELTS